ncbi:hypothetical protein [Bradyrhizobium sp. SK17]|nr:hypothetical protein [Bradyrhizobium sp. SK17]
MNQLVGGSRGQQMRGTSPIMSGFAGAALYQLDAATGAATIGELKAQ